jgi:6-pyruvoyltetrahydropterin/6-carboxytetrahydropterin synthase
MKRAKTKIDGMSPKEWMDYMFDHTVIVAEDDPELPIFKTMNNKGIIQLRVVPATGAEKFAEYLYKKLNKFVRTETNERVHVVKVEFMEHNKNTAIFNY